MKIIIFISEVRMIITNRWSGEKDRSVIYAMISYFNFGSENYYFYDNDNVQSFLHLSYNKKFGHVF